jgi:hypothetical protein
VGDQGRDRRRALAERGTGGLIRVYTPYLGQGRHRIMNFVAVEPVARGVARAL